MGNIKRDILFYYASLSVEKIIKEMREKYNPGRESEFSLQGITYKCLATSKEDGIEIGITSEIPRGRLIPGTMPTAYFRKFKKAISSFHHSHECNFDKDKHILMKCFYKYSDLYSEENILKEARGIMMGTREC